jgi:cysteine synthase A
MESHNGEADRDRDWRHEAIRKVEADANRSADTHLHVFPLPDDWGITLYLKDESVHPTGSLKHRLARSLFLYALVNGWISHRTTVVEASSGSTAISEAYFARLLDLPFIAVMPLSTSVEKVNLIESAGGNCRLVDDPNDIYDESRRIAMEIGGHFMDQFTYAERATDWRGNNNIASSIFNQLELEPYPVPEWIVVGAGTGGTSATIGRYIRYMRHNTKLCVVDPEGSVFYDSWATGASDAKAQGSIIEGIGRPRVEPSFIPTVIDRMIRIPDSGSIAAMRFVLEMTGRSVGGSTGTNVWGALSIVAEMLAAGRRGSVVTLVCDSGERYRQTYGSDDWLVQHNLVVRPYTATLRRFVSTGDWREPS